MIHLLLVLLPLLHGSAATHLAVGSLNGLPELDWLSGLLNFFNSFFGGQKCGLLSAQVANTINNKYPWYCPISNQVTNQWSKWLPVMLVVTMISFLLASLIFMVGVALGSGKIRNYGAAELYEAAATAIIVVAFVYICAVVFGFGPGALVGDINPYATAFNLMGSTLGSAQGMYTSLYKTYVPLSELTTVSIQVGGPEAGILRTSFASAAATAVSSNIFLNVFSFVIQVLFLNPAAALSKLLVEGMAVLYGEYYLLVFFSVAAIPVFLIPGVIFRALLPTRGLGGVMIALAIGFYLVMPSLFAAVYYFTAQGLITNVNVANAQLQATTVTGSSITSQQSPLVQELTAAQGSLSGFWMLVLFYPILIIAFTYSFVVQISKIIGGTYQQGAMGRLRGFL
ncbi:MAG: hypothetical protein KGH94_02655 [Candidatus Micrarchaeota archaeon]|nr:hypothetical protein [Candidatus Micrarchaeota archaeon]